MVSVCWFRHDLRVSDNPALYAAANSGQPVLCVFVDAKALAWPRGGATRVVMASALESLEKELKKLGANLHIVRLQNEKDFAQFCINEKASKVFWNRRYDRHSIESDSFVKQELLKKGVQVESFKGSVLLEPWEVKQDSGKPYQVYTPMFKVYERILKLEPLSETPKKIIAARLPTKEETVGANLTRWLPQIPWDTQIRKLWPMTESAASARLSKFLDQAGEDYKKRRDTPSDEEGTSRLSPYLALGVISPRQIFWLISKREDALFSSKPGIYHYQKEVIWREFANHLIFHFPKTDEKALRDNFDKFPWEDNEIHLEAWRRGQTGYPIVDAAMRELWTTGYMHNRSRMIVASFLVKQLRIHWLEGARWFWDTLVDADLASNTLGWQWSAGCGADAAPYFRIFNPVLQGEKFDAEGDYVKRWVPELKNLGPKFLHKPWEAPEEVLSAALIKLGETYPVPIVDHSEERLKALAAFKQISGKL
jgi:deoxyribodipyrimidine photo-lyase